MAGIRGECLIIKGEMNIDNMKIGLVHIDGPYPNLALMKIYNYYKGKDDDVAFFNSFFDYDKIYVSKIFKSSQDCPYIHQDSIKGGTGYDISVRLPDKINNSQPDYSLYPNCEFSIQRHSIGCLRKCSFCVVPKAEGDISVTSPMNLNPNGKWIEDITNNILAQDNWEESLKYYINASQPVNFHGIDARLINDEKAHFLSKIKLHKQIKIAWDHPKENIDQYLKILTKYIKPYKIMCYVLIGYNSTPAEDMYRIEKLREASISPFVMPYNKTDNYQRKLARWVNHKAIFKTVKWADYHN